MSKRAGRKKKNDQHREIPGLLVLGLPLLYLIAIFVVPIARGQVLHPEVVSSALVTGAIAVLMAVAAAWVAWRFLAKSNMVANAVFAVVIAGTCLWSVGMDRTDRDEARARVKDTVETHVAQVKDAAYDAID